MLISDEIEFITKNIVRDREEHSIMKKGSVHPEDK